MSNPQTKEKDKKVRVFALAKELNLESKVLVDLCKELGFAGITSQLNGLEPDQVDTLKERIKKGLKPTPPSSATPPRTIPPISNLTKVQTLPKGGSRPPVAKPASMEPSPAAATPTAPIATEPYHIPHSIVPTPVAESRSAEPGEPLVVEAHAGPTPPESRTTEVGALTSGPTIPQNVIPTRPALPGGIRNLGGVRNLNASRPSGVTPVKPAPTAMPPQPMAPATPAASPPQPSAPTPAARSTAPSAPAPAADSSNKPAPTAPTSSPKAGPTPAVPTGPSRSAPGPTSPPNVIPPNTGSTTKPSVLSRKPVVPPPAKDIIAGRRTTAGNAPPPAAGQRQGGGQGGPPRGAGTSAPAAGQTGGTASPNQGRGGGGRGGGAGKPGAAPSLKLSEDMIKRLREASARGHRMTMEQLTKPQGPGPVAPTRRGDESRSGQGSASRIAGRPQAPIETSEADDEEKKKAGGVIGRDSRHKGRTDRGRGRGPGTGQPAIVIGQGGQVEIIEQQWGSRRGLAQPPSSASTCGASNNPESLKGRSRSPSRSPSAACPKPSA